MSSKAEALISRMLAVNSEVIRAAEGCSAEQWQAPLGDEDSRAAGGVFHHIAISYDAIKDWVGNVVAGEPIPQLTRESLADFNAQHAQENKDVPKADTVAYLRQVTEDSAAKLQAFGDVQLERTTPVTLAGGGEFSAEWLMEAFCIGHAERHLAEISAAIGG